ncbi:hypothetical protein ACIRIR_35930 [Streptomyces globisporus]|uniref:hypothetical protein n=1 Tax=Streptomyces globisporus TaxID=1908 RepID=UPI00380F490E
MDFIRYRVVDADGAFLDEFATNSPDFARERIDRIRQHRPDLTVTETDDNR